MNKPTHLPKSNGRLWVGKKRLCYPLIRIFDEEMLRWACGVKVGEYIGTCEGHNRKVAAIDPDWSNVGSWRGRGEKRLQHYFLREVVFTDTKGSWHYCPGGGCAFPAETPEQITEDKRSFYSAVLNDEIEYYKDDLIKQQYAEKIMNRLTHNLPIVDEFGKIISELDRK